MTIADLSVSQLKNLVHLIQQRESLQAQLAKVEAALAQLDGAPARLAPRKAKPSRRTRRNLKDSILEVLAQAGPGGLTVKEIAAQAELKMGSVSVWMYTSGLKIDGVKKIAPGKFVYRGLS